MGNEAFHKKFFLFKKREHCVEVAPTLGTVVNENAFGTTIVGFKCD